MAFLEISSVTKSFGTVNVLQDVNLAIERGEFVVFVGPSGCGKSTLLRLDRRPRKDPTSGTIAIDGADVTDGEPASERGTRDGVPVLCALPAHDRLRRTCPLACAWPESRRASNATRSTGECSAPPAMLRLDRAISTASPSATLRRTEASASPSAAPSCASRASSCSTSRCPISTPNCASQTRKPSSCSCTMPSRHHHDLRHARPGRGDDAGRHRIVVLHGGKIQQAGAPLRTLRPIPTTASSPASSAPPR
jgi:energy-coupling factor transporter ATP-binding protein EcfA2